MMLNKTFLKDREISKYKQESKVRMPINICRFIFVIFKNLQLESILLCIFTLKPGKPLCLTIFQLDRGGHFY
jgi:hypothetical protein